MGAPRIGTIIDGYKFTGGNHRDQSNWRPVGEAEEAGTKKFAEVMATKDADRFAAAIEGQAGSYGNEITADRALELLNKDTPTGPLAEWRINAGKAVGGVPFLPLLPGIPSPNQTSNLELLRNIGSLGALGDVSKLKGPLSEKELSFIKQLQVDPNATKRTNIEVANNQKWIAHRQAAYGAAMQKWVEMLGSPSATNKDGLNFESWWGKYSAETLPAPALRSPNSAPKSPAASGPRPGMVEGGYRFTGGDPADPKNWRPVS